MQKDFQTLVAAFILSVAVVMAASSAALANASGDTQKFINKAVIGGQFEIESSQLALDRSTDPAVRNFAKKIISDHTRAASALNKAMAEAGLAANLKPTAMDKKHIKILDALRQEDVQDFDEKYAEAQKKAHNNAVNLYEDYADEGDNVALKEFAINTLPTLKSHEDHAKKLEKRVD